MAFRFGSGPILDVFPGAQAAYGLRRLSSTYNGPCITVRRSSDNATKNIGFSRFLLLDINDLLSFVGDGNGFVTTWFDQSGNNVNLSQGTAGSQFNIVSSGQLILEGNDIVMSGSTNRAFLRNTNSVSLSDWTVYLKSRATALFSHYVGHPGSTNGIMQHVNAQGYGYYNNGYISIGGGNSSYSTTYRKLQAKRNAITTNVRGYQNGINLGNANISISLNIGTSAQIFGNFAGGGYQGSVRECIIYPIEHDDFTLQQINNMM